MKGMFKHATSFQSDISKWDVSSVTNMNGMFMSATSFNGDISKWDVSSVTNMNGMFMSAASFNSDISKWDVFRVTGMIGMFMGATSFKQQLCGASWVYSKVTKKDMFKGSSGSILQIACTAAHTPVTTITTVFSPRSKSELRDAVKACVKLPPQGRCFIGLHGPIGEWDVSRVSDMSNMFECEDSMVHTAAKSFNGGIWKWDVSR